MGHTAHKRGDDGCEDEGMERRLLETNTKNCDYAVVSAAGLSSSFAG